MRKKQLHNETIADICEKLNVDERQAAIIKGIAKTEINLVNTFLYNMRPKEKWFKTMRTSEFDTIRLRIDQTYWFNLKQFEAKMVAFDIIYETCGIDWAGHNLEYKIVYCNTGDSYVNTICYDPSDKKFFIASWCDLMEYIIKKGKGNAGG